MNKIAFITGITGQDGSYLAEQLLEKGYEVCGLVRPRGHSTLGKLDYVDESKRAKIRLFPGDLTIPQTLHEAFKIVKPGEIYHLGAQTFVGNDIGSLNLQTNAQGTMNVLEAALMHCPEAHIYFAGTSEMFGNNNCEISTEKSPMRPASTYGLSKLAAYHYCQYYREVRKLWISCGILYNHESPRRGEKFVTLKIAKAVAEFMNGRTELLQLGNLLSARDWGFAPEYTDAMWRMLQHNKPDDFVVATGETHTVREFVEYAFFLAGIKGWEEYVHAETSAELRREDVHYLRGDATKAKTLLGWVPTVKFKRLVEILLDSELEKLGQERKILRAVQ